MRTFVLCIALLFAVTLQCSCATTRSRTAHADQSGFRFESEIRAFELSDKQDPPRPGQVLGVGSSSIRLWPDLGADLAPAPVINRGFGGYKTPEVLEVFDRVVTPYEPSVIVYYCGDNDLGDGSGTAWSAAEGFVRFADRVEREMPGTAVVYLSIKASVARWDRWPQMARANAIVESYCEAHEHAAYVDVASTLIGPDGEPDPAFFLDDGLHLNDKGYALWTEALRPTVLEAWQRSKGRD